jgi:hypothetical protein
MPREFKIVSGDIIGSTMREYVLEELTHVIVTCVTMTSFMRHLLYCMLQAYHTSIMSYLRHISNICTANNIQGLLYCTKISIFD